jgi:isopentenyl-diphosphate Delta-isomerase
MKGTGGAAEGDKELIVTVDAQDRPLGEEQKWECHRGEGILHRAFLLMVLNERKELLLARRSPGKILWPSFWDGTVASHVHRDESYEEAAARRLAQELGVRREDIIYLSKFLYKRAYRDIGTEHEVCAVLAAPGVHEADLAPASDEISEIRFIPPGRIALEKDVSPWLLIALEQPEVKKFMGLEMPQ